MLKDQHNLHKLSVNVHMTVKERKGKGNNILLQIFNIYTYIYLGAHHLWTTYEKWPTMPSQLTGRRQTPSEQRCFPTMYIKCLQGEWHTSGHMAWVQKISAAISCPIWHSIHKWSTQHRGTNNIDVSSGAAGLKAFGKEHQQFLLWERLECTTHLVRLKWTPLLLMASPQTHSL